METTQVDKRPWEQPQIEEYDEDEVLGKVKVAAQFTPEGKTYQASTSTCTYTTN
jgi:hypothetical protein